MFTRVCSLIPGHLGESENHPSSYQVLIKGRHVFMGYMWEGQATRNTFTEDGWLKTGDLGHISEVSVTCEECDM